MYFNYEKSYTRRLATYTCTHIYPTVSVSTSKQSLLLCALPETLFARTNSCEGCRCVCVALVP